MNNENNFPNENPTANDKPNESPESADGSIVSEKKTSKFKINKRAMLFIKAMSITLTSFLVVLVSGLAVIRGMVKPPEIPPDDIVPVRTIKIEAATEKPTNEDYEPPEDEDEPVIESGAYVPIEADEEDMYIGNGLRAPDGFTVDDRKEEFYTFLIVGLDGGVNTDTIMVASYDGKKNTADIISIPRDSYVNVKRNVKKINAAYPAGTLHGGGREGGIEQLKREIKTIIGFVPDFHICVDLNAFTKIVDAVGGVEVYVPIDMIYDDPDQNLHIDIRKGTRLLDGKNALKFSRYRNGNSQKNTISDYQRIENQQAVIKALLAKLLAPSSMLKIPEFIDIFYDHVYSNISLANMLWFAEQFKNVTGTDALSTHTLPTKGTSGMPNYYEYLDEAAIVELVNNSVNPYKKNIEAKDLDIIARP